MYYAFSIPLGLLFYFCNYYDLECLLIDLLINNNSHNNGK